MRRVHWESMEIKGNSDNFEGKKSTLTDLRTPLGMGQCVMPGVDATPRTRHATGVHGSGREPRFLLQRLERRESTRVLRRRLGMS
jgi:hypothetical protein